MDSPRKKSPRAPSIALDEAIDRAVKVYEKERRHAAPVDVIAQDMGYKSANNGAALAVLASLRYYGLLERPEEGKLAVSRDVESYNYAPSEDLRRQILLRWIRSPVVFADLLDKYQSGLPSDATLRFDLIQRGFAPSAAESVLAVFKRSVEFAGYFREAASVPAATATGVNEGEPGNEDSGVASIGENASPRQPTSNPELPSESDRIPVRLSGGRRAWLVLPSPFFEADKKLLKAQIDLVLSDDVPPVA